MTDDVWREFFDSYAPQYMNEVFTADSVREAAFLVDVLGLEPRASVLDIACGTGRHAVELARRVGSRRIVSWPSSAAHAPTQAHDGT